MSTATVTTVNPPASPAARIWNVHRLHLANPWTTLYWPWMIMALIFLGNWVIAWVLQRTLPAEAAEGAARSMSFNGGVAFIFIYMMVVAIQAISISFPFALGYGATRRDFYLGSALTLVLLGLGYSIAMALLSLLEEATGGWGVGLRLLGSPMFGENALQRFVIYLVLFAFFSFFGMMIASIWVRWKAMGVTAFFVVLGAVVIAAVALTTLAESWGAVGQFFVHWGVMGSILWLLVPAAVSVVTGFLLLRRATPRE